MGLAITVTSVQTTDGIVITQAGRTDISVAVAARSDVSSGQAKHGARLKTQAGHTW